MNKNIKRLFLVIKDNKPVAIESNLKELEEQLINIIPGLTYNKLYNWFKANKSFTKTFNNGTVYHFHQVDNENA